MVLIDHNNTIYMGGDMFDLLDNPIQCEDNDAIVELRLKLYGTNNNKS